MKLPNDREGRSWIEVKWNETPLREQSIVATLITLDEDLDEITFLGNAFVISAQGDTAICLAAAHSFEKAKQIQRARTALRDSNVAPDFRVKGPEYIEKNKIKAYFLIDGEPVVCDIGQLNYLTNYDVALFSVYDPEAARIFRHRPAIDLGAPTIGDEVAILANHISIEKQAVKESHVRQRLSLRIGVVTEVQMGRAEIPGQSFYFQTTIPATAGMSGAPVIHKPTPGKPMIVRGVVSSDFSDPDAFSSFSVGGRSTASMLWPAMGLALHVTIPPNIGRSLFLGDLVEKKIVDNRTDGVIVKVRQPCDKTEILYVDQRGIEAIKVLLTTPAHTSITD